MTIKKHIRGDHRFKSYAGYGLRRNRPLSCHAPLLCITTKRKAAPKTIRSGQIPGGVLPIMAYKKRLRSNAVSLSGFRYMKG